MEKQKKKRIPTSKFLAYIVTIVWMLTVFISFLGWFLDKSDFTILITVSSAFTIVLNGFLAKSFFENKEQYGGSPAQTNITIQEHKGE